MISNPIPIAKKMKLGVASECGKCGKLAQTIVKEFHKIGSYTNAA